jgi:hypothetical protein
MGSLTFSLCLRSHASSLISCATRYSTDRRLFIQRNSEFEDPKVARITEPGYRASEFATFKQNIWVFWYGWVCIPSFILTHWCGSFPKRPNKDEARIESMAIWSRKHAGLLLLHQRCTWAAAYLVLRTVKRPQEAWLSCNKLESILAHSRRQSVPCTNLCMQAAWTTFSAGWWSQEREESFRYVCNVQVNITCTGPIAAHNAWGQSYSHWTEDKV